jgi:flagellar FliL protein
MAAKKETEAAPKKGGGMKKVLIASVAGVALCAGSAFAALFLTGSLEKVGLGGHSAAQSAKAHGEDAEEEEEDAASDHKKPAQYVTLDPPFVVNFQDEGGLRYLQVNVSLMTRRPDAVAAVQNNLPRIRDRLILLFGEQDFQKLSSSVGKEKLRGEALAAVQDILKEETGRKGVDNMYFTNFVMQ